MMIDDGNDDYNDGVLVLHLGENMYKHTRHQSTFIFARESKSGL